jgi:fumarylacetoacetate (FAA) hydrolase
MRLASLRAGRDGELAVVAADGRRYLEASGIASTLQAALDTWSTAEPALRSLAERLEGDAGLGKPLDLAQLSAPLPRAYEWVDGSSYLNHIMLVRRARGAAPPEDLYTDPLVYQGGSGKFLAPTEPITLQDPTWGLDFEAEVAVVLTDTPRGTTALEAPARIALLLLVNDITLRELVPAELKKGFGFFQSKPASALSPFAVTPDELGDAFRGGRLHLPLCSSLNGKLVGAPEAGAEMHFSFFDLIAHISKTRAFTAGTILGGGTVSNADPARGFSCLAEARTRETLELGAPRTPYLRVGDTVEIEMLDEQGVSIFGAIRQQVVAA